MPEFSARHVWSLISKVVLISLVLENFFCENQLMLVQALNNQIWPHFDPAPPSVSLGLPPTFYPFFSTVGSSVALNCICRLYFSIVFLNWISQLYFSIPFSIAFTNCISQKDVHRLSHVKSRPLFTLFSPPSDPPPLCSSTLLHWRGFSHLFCPAVFILPNLKTYLHLMNC